MLVGTFRFRCIFMYTVVYSCIIETPYATSTGSLYSLS